VPDVPGTAVLGPNHLILREHACFADAASRPCFELHEHWFRRSARRANDGVGVRCAHVYCFERPTAVNAVVFDCPCNDGTRID